MDLSELIKLLQKIETIEENVLSKYRNSITRKAFLEAMNEIKIIVSGDR